MGLGKDRFKYGNKIESLFALELREDNKNFCHVEVTRILCFSVEKYVINVLLFLNNTAGLTLHQDVERALALVLIFWVLINLNKTAFSDNIETIILFVKLIL